MAKKFLCCTITAMKVHQVFMSIFGLLNTVAAVWLIANDDYPFKTSGEIRGSVARVVLHCYQIVLSHCLLMAAAFGARLPLEWFGLLTGFVGSGFYLIFLGFLTLSLDTIFGLVVGILTIVYGVGSIIYGYSTKKEMLESGTSYRNLTLD
ncbi:hypothetical protein SPRG_07519 [Saprolegnia parasitica CBS 223.65]|uniref:Uncharacterized protein n=1 Tax=Saprolegnia parasitica (strain CBS 223.65) TaxID=695850 RepID=A0A067CDN6_SAPPC|nr:hypothetical protein SPRG_07519 [Saprolegnia parasitica CBS 223.65]KDO27270.1 hypothetical protein SPRG_07519 [Saprolegnia parasitica CBS 223.65]|eukprot:XP_012202046.1 hypothetical protein SPRG_07519 [Saprolegnia parasitica CBS 223.65]